jgi:hypothetical protein
MLKPTLRLDQLPPGVTLDGWMCPHGPQEGRWQPVWVQEADGVIYERALCPDCYRQVREVVPGLPRGIWEE